MPKLTIKYFTSIAQTVHEFVLPIFETSVLVTDTTQSRIIGG